MSVQNQAPGTIGKPRPFWTIPGFGVCLLATVSHPQQSGAHMRQAGRQLPTTALAKERERTN